MNYKINDATYPRVSTILDLLNKPALVNWAANQAIDKFRAEVGKMITDELCEAVRTSWRDKSDTALDVGSAVHAAIEADKWMDKGDAPDEVYHAYSAWKNWFQATMPEILAKEVVVYHPELSYAGRFDAIYRDKQGRVILADWKTSGAIYPEYKLQLALYIAALRAMPNNSDLSFEVGQVTGKQSPLTMIPTAGEIVRLDKTTGEFESYILEGDELERQIGAAEHLVKFYYLHKARRVSNAGSKRVKKVVK